MDTRNKKMLIERQFVILAKEVQKHKKSKGYFRTGVNLCELKEVLRRKVGNRKKKKPFPHKGFGIWSIGGSNP
ncbi:hypothetical protein [Bacillus oleivorans]|uniref:hypothetical protein n=1 Tax=Bacillus oleivorans TaxID=1448271 RepID=UPI000BE3C53F|nr:hypothetical protein [Bacillus oleivorans]